jgi:hypothetical protein
MFELRLVPWDWDDTTMFKAIGMGNFMGFSWDFTDFFRET